MKMIKTLSATLALLMLSSCATLFGDKNTFHKAPVFCVIDFIFGFTILVPIVNQLNGSCKIDNGFMNNAFKTNVSI